MKTTENKSSRLLPGMGYLLGSLLTLVLAISLFVLTENFVIAISSSLPLGTTIGIILEKRFQEGDNLPNANTTKIFTFLILLGIMLFFVILFL